MSENLYHWLFGRASRQPDQVFLDCPGGPTLSYRDMDGLAARYAAVLRELGVTPDDRVVVQVDKSIEAVALYLACLRLGAIYVPLNAAYTASETAFFLDDCEPRLAILTAERRAELRATIGPARMPRAVSLTGPDDALASRAAGCQPDAQVVARETTDLAAIIYTSGTTGRAKGAMLSVSNLRSNAQALYQAWGWREDDVLIHALPIFHVHGLFVALHCAILGGSRVLFLPRFDVADILAALSRGTVMMGVPTFYTRLLAEPGFTRGACQHTRLFISGSAPLSPRTFAEFELRTGHLILERYGMSEAGIITSNPLEGPRLAGTVGFALREVEVRVAHAEGQVAADDAVGELEVRGPNLFRGYWGLSEKTKSEFRSDGFFKTGDLAQMSSDGRVSIVGRERDLIISGGYNVYPREIEGHLDDLPEISESAVVGVPHPDLGEAVVAVVVAAVTGEFDPRAIEQALGGRLARFKHPKRFFMIDALPRNAMGKVQKAALRERYKSAFT